MVKEPVTVLMNQLPCPAQCSVREYFLNLVAYLEAQVSKS